MPDTHDRRDDLVTWLRDAHAMEKGTVDNIERIIDHLQHQPALAERYRTHLEESKVQRERLERCLKHLDADPSTLKDIGMRGMGLAESLVTKMTRDEPVKDCLAGYAYEQFEIASYVSLIAAAEELGETEIAQLCSQSLREERDMAAWLEKHIPEVTRAYVHS